MRGYTWTENGFTFKRINKAQARWDMPEIAARYTKTTETRRFLFV